MSTIAKLSNGTLLKLGDGAGPEVFTTIPEVDKVTGPAVKFDLVDVSSHDSPGLFREYIPGFSDGDMIRAALNWRASNAVHKRLRVDQYAATLRNVKLIFPDSSDNTVLSSTYIQELAPNADAGKQMAANLGFKITGAPAWS